MSKMNHVKLALATTIILFAPLLFQSCTMKGTPIVVLETPKFVPQSQPESPVETGISEDASSVGVFLQWNHVDGASGYNIYRADSTGSSGIPFRLVRAVSNDTSYVDGASITTGVTYFYRMQAYSSAQDESKFSDTVHITLLEKPGLISPVSLTVNASGLQFTWKYMANTSDVLIRIKDVSLGHAGYVWISKLHNDWYSGSGISVAFNVDSTATGQLTSGDSYLWRIDQYNLGTDEQTKSVWGTFGVK